MATLDPDMAALVADGDAWPRHRRAARTAGHRVRARRRRDPRTARSPADLVVLGLGVAPELGAGRGRPGIELGRQGRDPGRPAPGARRPRACGPPATAPRRPTSSPASRCTSRSARTPTSTAGWPASTSAGGDARSPMVLGTAITKVCEHRDRLAPASTEAEAASAGFDARGRRPSRATTRAGYFPAAPMTVEARGRAGHGPAARRADRRRRRRGQADRHVRRGHHRRHDVPAR